MLKIFHKILIVVLASLMLVSCGGTPPPTQDINAVMTAAISTMVVSFFETQTAMAPLATPTLEPSLTPVPTATVIIPTATFPPPPTAVIVYNTPVLLGTAVPIKTLGTPGTVVTATIDPSSLGSGCNNLAFIRDVAVPPGTVLKPGENFTRIWKVQNTGTCPWMFQYSLVLVSGEEFSAGGTKLGRQVAVNDWSEISLNMDAPNKEGKYVSYWRLSDNTKPFGATLVVSFEVVK
jgi:hypothetical protein